MRGGEKVRKRGGGDEMRGREEDSRGGGEE